MEKTLWVRSGCIYAMFCTFFGTWSLLHQSYFTLSVVVWSYFYLFGHHPYGPPYFLCCSGFSSDAQEISSISDVLPTTLVISSSQALPCSSSESHHHDLSPFSKPSDRFDRFWTYLFPTSMMRTWLTAIFGPATYSFPPPLTPLSHTWDACMKSSEPALHNKPRNFLKFCSDNDIRHVPTHSGYILFYLQWLSFHQIGHFRLLQLQAALSSFHSWLAYPASSVFQRSPTCPWTLFAFKTLIRGQLTTFEFFLQHLFLL